MDDQQVPTPVAEPTNEQSNEQPLTNEVEQPQVEVQQSESPEQDAQETAVVPEQPQVEQETPESAEVQEDDDDYVVPFTPDMPQEGAPGLDLSQVEQNEDGTLNADSLARAMQEHSQQVLQQAAGMVQQAEERRQEENLWVRAREKYPELKTDKALAQETQALRYGMFMAELTSGKTDAKMLTPAQAFERYSKRTSMAKAEGVKQATESVRVQESAYVESPSNSNFAAKGGEDALFQKMRSGNRVEAEKAANEILMSRLFGE